MKKIIAFVVVILLLCGALTACAPTETTDTTSKVEVTIDALMAVIPVDKLLESDPMVIRGSVLGIEKAVDLNSTTSAGYEKRMVHTYYNLDVKETFMGAETKKITIVEMGGETETQIVKVNGIVQPQKGEERYFFLWRDGRSHYSFPIQDGKVTVNKTELPELFGSSATDKNVNSKQIPVEEFETILRAKIAARNSEK